jgi:hypothetical protein
MSLSPNEKYPGATEADPNYKDSKFKDNNPSTTNNGSPLKALDRNEQLALQEAMMNAAGFDYNGVVDTPQNSQMFNAYKAALSNGANLLSNHNFIIASPDDSQPAPSATPTSYPPGYEIFSGVFANETTGILNLTYIDGRVSFSGGDFYMAVPNTGALENITEFVASVADFDGKPRTRGVSYALVGDEYRVTVGVDALEDESANETPLGSVKFEQGSVATGHEVNKSITGLNIISGLPVNVIDFGADFSGAEINDDVLQDCLKYSTDIVIPKGVVLRVSDIPQSITSLSGGGRLIWDNDAVGPDPIVYTMPDGFSIDDLRIETIYRNRLAIRANDLQLNLVKEFQSDARTDQARYNAVEWQSETSISVSKHVTYNTGARFIAVGNDCSLDVNGIVTRVDHVGEGPDGSNHGVDGIKVSSDDGFSMRSQNISNHKCFGTSRDIIDTFTGGGECNISNVWADGFYFNQVEIKSEGDLASGENDTPHDINITNVNCRAGGLGDNDTFAAILIVNQNEGELAKSPRRINITNYNTRKIGLLAGGAYYGVRALGAFNLNLSNTNILQAKDHGANLTRCQNVKFTNSNVHGVSRGFSMTDTSRVSLSNSTIGYDEETNARSNAGIVASGVCDEVNISSGSKVLGTSKSITAEGATINNMKADSSFLTGPVRIDTFTNVEFNNTDIDALSTPAGSIDAFLSSAAVPAAELTFIGGKIKNARRGINEQSLTQYQCIGTRFENTSSPMGGVSSDNRRVILGCISNGGGSFPTPSGQDQIENNIEI